MQNNDDKVFSLWGTAQEAGTIRREIWTSPAEIAPLPVLSARGLRDGPTLLVTGGVHGDEYEGPQAIFTLFDRLDAAELRGRVVGLPICNVAAWNARARVSPSDGVNLNRVFNIAGAKPAPSLFAAESPTATAALPTERLAAAIFDTFVRNCDALIDLHSGGIALVHLPLVGWYRGAAGETANGAETLARNFHLALHPWILPDVPGVLSYEAQRIGKTALGAEWHGGARLDPYGADAYAAGLRRVLAALGMLPSHDNDLPEENGLPDTRPPICGDYQETEQGGLFVPAVALGDVVARGSVLGSLRDALGNVSGDIRAERGGIVAGLPHIPLLSPGDRVAYIG